MYDEDDGGLGNKKQPIIYIRNLLIKTLNWLQVKLNEIINTLFQILNLDPTVFFSSARRCACLDDNCRVGLNMVSRRFTMYLDVDGSIDNPVTIDKQTLLVFIVVTECTLHKKIR